MRKSRTGSDTRWETAARDVYSREVGVADPAVTELVHIDATTLPDLVRSAHRALRSDAALFDVQLAVVAAVREALRVVLPWLGTALARADLLPELADRAAWTTAYERAVLVETVAATERLDALEGSLTAWRAALPAGRSTSRLGDVVDVVLTQPFVTAAGLARELGIGRWAVSMHLRTLLEYGVVRSVGDQTKGRAFVLADLREPPSLPAPSPTAASSLQVRTIGMQAAEPIDDYGAAVARTAAAAGSVLGESKEDVGGDAVD